MRGGSTSTLVHSVGASLRRVTVAGSMDRRPGLGLGRTSDTGRPVAALLPFLLEVVVPGGCPSPHLSYMDLALGLPPGQWLEPYLSSARWNLELHLPLC